MPFAIEVDCQPGHAGEPVPHVLHFGQACLAVKALVDSWSGHDHHYFKLLGEDGATYIVRHDLPTDRWELVFYDSGKVAGK